jgi:ribosomal protein L16 Arg81 hydroxylase
MKKKTGYPNYYKKLTTWVDGILTYHDYLLPMALTDRRMNIIEVGKITNVSSVCQALPSNGILVLTACRTLNQVMKTQVYKPSPSLQQVIDKLQKLKLKDKQNKKRSRQS